jgi:hypothetical protein
MAIQAPSGALLFLGAYPVVHQTNQVVCTTLKGLVRALGLQCREKSQKQCLWPLYVHVCNFQHFLENRITNEHLSVGMTLQRNTFKFNISVKKV